MGFHMFRRLEDRHVRRANEHPNSRIGSSKSKIRGKLPPVKCRTLLESTQEYSNWFPQRNACCCDLAEITWSAGFLACFTGKLFCD